MIKIKSLYAGYNKKAVIKNISANIKEGEFVCVIGPNGSGKSTFLKSLCSIIQPISGEIEVDGKSVAFMKRSERARLVSYLQQENVSVNMTAGQFVLKGRYPHLGYPKHFSKIDEIKSEEAMRRLGILELSHIPVSSLSGGMKQSVYLAMALCQDTKILLMDEPTTYLDIANKIKIMKTLKDLSLEGKCVICVIHDISLALEFADRILLINDGALVADTTPELIVKSSDFESAFGVKISRINKGCKSAYSFDLI